MPQVLAIVGCTATGKSALAELAAERLGGEVVSADSMQVYRGMDIGTSKVPAGERHVPYHCLDLADPGEPFSAALYQAAARAAIEGIIARGKVPVVCGGTGLYVRAALEDMRFPSGEQEGNPVREHYAAIAEEQGSAWLHAELCRRDPASAALIHPNNTRRVIRALEMHDAGLSYSEQHRGFSQHNEMYDTVYIGLAMDAQTLYGRIDARVDQMVSEGLLEEIERLLDAGFERGLTAPQAIGYKELVPMVKAGLGVGSPECNEALEAIKQATRRYAKRQRTWFRKDSRIRWVDASTGRFVAGIDDAAAPSSTQAPESAQPIDAVLGCMRS